MVGYVFAKKKKYICVWITNDNSAYDIPCIYFLLIIR